MNTKDVLVVVLAGGEGKRFYPLVTDKSMFPFMGKRLIDWVFDEIQRAGFEQVLVATNEKNNEYIKSVSDGLVVRTKQQPKPLGQADALRWALDNETDRAILVMNAVDLVEASLLSDLVTTEAEVVLTGKVMNEYFPGGYLTVDGERVVGIVEKPEPDERPSNMVNLVEHFFASSAMLVEYLNRVPQGRDDEYEQALDMMMKEKEVRYVEYEGYWQKLKYPHFVLDMMEMLLEEKLETRVAESTMIADSASIEGTVWVDEGVRIMAGASVVGPVYLGKNVVVGQNTLVRQSMVEAGSVVGFGSEVSRSYVGPGCMLHHNFVGDTVLEAEVNPSWGTTFANWRLFDSRSVGLRLPNQVIDSGRKKLGAVVAANVKMGVNCSVMPGVTIAAGSKIYPGSVVTGAVKGEWGFEKRK